MNAMTEYLHHGGVVLGLLILCGVLTVCLVVERAWTFRKATAIDPEKLLDDIKKAYSSGDTTNATRMMEQANTAYARIFTRGLRNYGRSPETMEMAMRHEAANELPTLENYLPGLRTVTTAAPLLGLLGTLVGMIGTFQSVPTQGGGESTTVWRGVAEALIPSAIGVGVALVGLLADNYFRNLVKRFAEDMAYYGDELTNFLTGRIA